MCEVQYTCVGLPTFRSCIVEDEDNNGGGSMAFSSFRFDPIIAIRALTSVKSKSQTLDYPELVVDFLEFFLREQYKRVVVLRVKCPPFPSI